MFAWRALVGMAVCCVALATIGCEGNGNLATVTGVVTHNGSPVDGAKVEFHGTTEQEGGAKDIFATYTDSSGKYMIAGVGQSYGIPPGLYKVAISKIEGDMQFNRPEDGMDAGQLEAQMSDMAPGVGLRQNEVKNLLPAEHGSVATSKLSATVNPGKNENVNFDL